MFVPRGAMLNPLSSTRRAKLNPLPPLNFGHDQSGFDEIIRQEILEICILYLFCHLFQQVFRNSFISTISRSYKVEKRGKIFKCVFFTVDTCYCCCFEQQQPIYIVCMTYVNEYKQNIMKVFSFNLKYLFQINYY